VLLAASQKLLDALLAKVTQLDPTLVKVDASRRAAFVSASQTSFQRH
jgi:hypothetical protein